MINIVMLSSNRKVKAIYLTQHCFLKPRRVTWKRQKNADFSIRSFWFNDPYEQFHSTGEIWLSDQQWQMVEHSFNLEQEYGNYTVICQLSSDTSVCACLKSRHEIVC